MDQWRVRYDEAVSPVIGILLMLVVTIIIAAVVSGFAGGLVGGQEKAPSVAISAQKIVVDEIYDTVQGNDWNFTCPAGRAQNAYVMFENSGGEGIPINDIQVRVSSLKYPADRVLIDNSVTPNGDTAATGNKADIKDPNMKSWKNYLEAFPDRTSSVVSPGSKFVLHFDGGKAVQSSTYPNYKSVDLRAYGMTSSLSTTEGDYLVYDIIDKKSKKTISSGKVLVPQFTVFSS
jgi:flagellin-like protein